MKMIKKAKKGFTLIELVVVIAVIAILSGVSVVAYVGITNNAKKSAAQSEATEIVTTIRAGILAHSDGYDESSYSGAKAAVEGCKYHADLDSRELKFTVEKVTAESVPGYTDEALVKDMLEELGEPTLKEKEIKVVTAEKVTKIGVLIQGKDSAVDSNYAYVAF